MAGPKAKARRVDYYPDEFLVGVTGMTAEQIGVYWVVCSLIYSTGGPIQENDERILRCGGVSSRRWPGLRRELMDRGKLFVVDGHLHNRRSMLELEKVLDRVSEAQINGGRGGRPRKPGTPEPGAEPAEKSGFSSSSAGVHGEFSDSSQGVRSEAAAHDGSEINHLAKPNGFPPEKLTTNQQPTTKNPPLTAPPAGGQPAAAGEDGDRDLLGDDSAGASRRKGGAGAGRGTRVPRGDLPEEWAAAANQLREKHEMPLLNKRVLRLRWDSFSNYWNGLAGSKALRRDWKSVWLNDCISGVTERKFPPGPPADSRRAPMFDTTG